MKWSDITQQYSGLFFRAEGSGSEQFGKVQQSNQSIITNINYNGFYSNNLVDSHYDIVDFNLKPGSWSVRKTKYEVYSRRIYQMNFYTSDGEVRPKNTAI